MYIKKSFLLLHFPHIFPLFHLSFSFILTQLLFSYGLNSFSVLVIAALCSFQTLMALCLTSLINLTHYKFKSVLILNIIF